MQHLRQSLLLIALLLNVVACAHAQPQPGDPAYINITPNNPSIVIGEEYSDWAYTDAFAKRFKLDKRNVEELSPGLLAIEFRAEASTNKGISHTCYFNVYIDSKLPIQYPENKRSAGYLKDLQHINKSLPYGNRSTRDKNNQPIEWMFHAGLTANKLEKPLISEHDSRIGIKINSYKENIFPGISYLSLQKSDCSAILPPRYFLQLLLRKTGQFDSIANIDYQLLNKIDVPQKLHKRICPIIEKISYLSFNKILLNTPNLMNLYKSTKERINAYPLGCQ